MVCDRREPVKVYCEIYLGKYSSKEREREIDRSFISVFLNFLLLSISLSFSLARGKYVPVYWASLIRCNIDVFFLYHRTAQRKRDCGEGRSAGTEAVY